MSENRGMVRHIPNILTLLNLACGSLAIYFIGFHEWMMVSLLIGIGGLADFLDGLVARALKVSSPIGAQLDSLADMISFGVAPGLILFELLMLTQGGAQYRSAEYQSDHLLLALPALLFPICAALRLARFNTEDDSSGDFKGLSTPAATATVIGYVLVAVVNYFGVSYPPLYDPFPNQNAVYIFCLVLPLLMVSNIGMFSLKFKGMKWKENEIRWIFIGLFILLLILSPIDAIIITMMLYILTNTILHFYRKLTA